MKNRCKTYFTGEKKCDKNMTYPFGSEKYNSFPKGGT